MRRISANYVFPVDQPPIRNGIVETDDNGTIQKVYNFGGEMRELAHTEFLNGVLVPGFINMHTHLELAWHVRNENGRQEIAEFIEKILQTRPPKNRFKRIAEADEQMYRNGTVAACDIAGTTDTIDIKKQSPIQYHTFAEVAGLNTQTARARFEKIREVYQHFREAGLSVSVTPHSPYALSQTLWNILLQYLNSNTIISIHNQESSEENQIFTRGDGKLADKLTQLGLTDKKFEPTDKSAIQNIFGYIKNNPHLLVHNTFTSPDDVDFIHQHRSTPTGWVICPTSNHYISGQIADIKLLESTGDPVMLGTDSPASGQSLSLLDEIKYLQQHHQLPFEKILRWSTLNGAIFMNWSKLGSITAGKKPGLNLIRGFNFEQMQLNMHATVKRII